MPPPTTTGRQQGGEGGVLCRVLRCSSACSSHCAFFSFTPSARDSEVRGPSSQEGGAVPELKLRGGGEGAASSACTRCSRAGRQQRPTLAALKPRARQQPRFAKANVSRVSGFGPHRRLFTSGDTCPPTCTSLLRRDVGPAVAAREVNAATSKAQATAVVKPRRSTACHQRSAKQATQKNVRAAPHDAPLWSAPHMQPRQCTAV